MDLNYLLHRHQVSLMRAEAATSAPARIAHEGMATLYAGVVARNQLQSGGSAALLQAVAGRHGE